ncbi:hypothetical protein llap_7443 [Limosa lapponica baueri]|uniref:Uncharacterized protein n=1 Tax=Limosa lapponica baueri TaxID=1758121 RepID=A0A2I0U886_LIMLA|nr:hypothetical protein llap_7443 [Limosa lapponica baueri]
MGQGLQDQPQSLAVPAGCRLNSASQPGALLQLSNALYRERNCSPVPEAFGYPNSSSLCFLVTGCAPRRPFRHVVRPSQSGGGPGFMKHIWESQDRMNRFMMGRLEGVAELSGSCWSPQLGMLGRKPGPDHKLQISLQNLKQATALAPGREADAATLRCKWSMVQPAAWYQFVLPPNQAHQPSSGAQSAFGWDMAQESLGHYGAEDAPASHKIFWYHSSLRNKAKCGTIWRQAVIKIKSEHQYIAVVTHFHSLFPPLVCGSRKSLASSIVTSLTPSLEDLLCQSTP